MGAINYQPQRKVVAVLGAQAAGTTDVNTLGVNTAGFRSVEFICKLGALTATQVTTLKAQQSDDNAAADAYSDIAGTQTDAAADADSNDVFRLEVVKPTKPWVRAVVERGTENAVVESVVAILSGPEEAAITEDDTVIDSVSVVAAAEGTA